MRLSEVVAYVAGVGYAWGYPSHTLTHTEISRVIKLNQKAFLRGVQGVGSKPEYTGGTTRTDTKTCPELLQTSMCEHQSFALKNEIPVTRRSAET